ncbi:MAG: hypothetical protein NZ956_02475 [Candidatus Caldarchaeum sp.]|nr:hypothetical protein [Candidatus Caldarchaeum sp.]
MSLKVSISYGELKADFEGEPADVYRNVVAFLEKTIPSFSLASKLNTAAGVDEILEKIKNFVAYDTSSGLYFKTDLSKLPTSTAILLFGVLKHLNHLLGHGQGPDFLSAEVSAVLGRPDKTVSGRLAELVKKGQLKRLGRGGYSITSAGLSHVVESSLDI